MNLGYKINYTCTILYFIVIVIIDFEFLKNLKNNQINSWPKCNQMTLAKTMILIIKKINIIKILPIKLIIKWKSENKIF